jgi:cytochrome P450
MKTDEQAKEFASVKSIGIPAFLQLCWYSLNPYSFLKYCSRLGDRFIIHLAGFGKLFILSNPKDIETVFSGSPDVLYSGEVNQFMIDLFGPNSVILLDGSVHRRQRKLLLPSMHGGRLDLYIQEMYQIAKEHISKWPERGEVRVLDAMQEITQQVILRIVFGIHDLSRYAAFKNDVRRLLQLGASPFALIAPVLPRKILSLFQRWTSYVGLIRKIDAEIYDVIAERRKQNTEGRDVLSILLKAVDEKGEAMSDQEIRDELITMLTAGFETTAVGLSWAVERILFHPAVVQKIILELEQTVPGKVLLMEHLSKLNYLDACIKESLRSRTMIPIVVRRVKKTFQMNGINISPETTLAPSIFLAHHREASYPEPERFIPERFLNQPVNPYAWLPFGGGHRTCLGMGFALTEMKVVLATLFLEKNLSLVSQSPERYGRRGIIMAPAQGVRIRTQA